MNTFRFVLLFVQCLGLFRFSHGASVDESAKPRTTVLNLFHMRGEVLSTNQQPGGDEYYYEGDEDDLSGDYEPDYPMVAYSSKPKDSSAIAVTGNKTKSKKTSKGTKKNPCLKKKYRNFCIHGVCQFLKELKKPTCVCDAGYSGERCLSFSLPVGREKGGFNQTTSLVIMAVILSTLCLTIIGILLAFRYHKKRGTDVESEEKIKLEAATVQ